MKWKVDPKKESKHSYNFSLLQLQMLHLLIITQANEVSEQQISLYISTA